MSTETITVTEVAKRIGRSRTTIYAALKAGDIPGGRRISGTWVIARRPFEAWLAGGDIAAAEAAVPEHPQIPMIHRRAS